MVDLCAGPGHEVEGEPDEGHDPQQVGPDVAGLGVDPGSQSQLSIQYREQPITAQYYL